MPLAYSFLSEMLRKVFLKKLQMVTSVFSQSTKHCTYTLSGKTELVQSVKQM